MEVTRQSLEAGIEQMRDGNRLYDIGEAVQTVAEGAGFSVVREYVGPRHRHGHARGPAGPQLRPPGNRGIKLKVGHVFAVEPMVNAGGPDTTLLDDGWTVVTADGSLRPTSSTPSRSPPTAPRC